VIFGPARIEVPEEHVSTLLVNEILNPFFVFQSFCILLWFNDGSAWYASFILVYNLIVVVASLVETLKNNRNFRKMQRHECEVKIL
jgi:cation-transporting P-type ATPase 13A2